MKSAHGRRKAPDPELDADSELELLARAEHLRVIFKHYLIVLVANVSAGATLAAGLWSAVPKEGLAAWLAVMVLFNLARLIKSRQLAARPPDLAEVRQREFLLLGSTLTSGVLWGVAAIWFYVPGAAALNMFLALVLVAITAASAVLLSFHRLAYPIFCAPVVIPLAIQLGIDHGASHSAVALVIPLYYSLLLVLSRQVYRFSHEAILTSLVRERHALVDHLTAIPNRRAFEEFLEREWMRAIRTRSSLTLILSDIDGFKTYNDRYGHAVGDAVLRSVAGLFQKSARRSSDLAARIGGDEFAIIAPDTNQLGAEEIVKNIEKNRDGLARGTFKSWSFPTLTFGYCTVSPSEEGSAFSLFEMADAALYQAKAAGGRGAAGCAGH